MSSMGDFILFDFIPDRNTHACLLLAARCRGVLPISSVCWVWNENPWHLERASTQWIEPFSAAMWRGSLSFTSRWHKGDVSFSCRRISKNLKFKEGNLPIRGYKILRRNSLYIDSYISESQLNGTFWGSTKRNSVYARWQKRLYG